MDNPFSDNEVNVAVRKLSNGKSAGDHCPAEYFKALEEDGATKGYLREVVTVYWKSGSFPSDDIPSGPPPALAEPTMALAVKNGWRIVLQQANPKTPGPE